MWPGCRPHSSHCATTLVYCHQCLPVWALFLHVAKPPSVKIKLCSTFAGKLQLLIHWDLNSSVGPQIPWPSQFVSNLHHALPSYPIISMIRFLTRIVTKMRKLILACKKIHRQAMQGWKCDAISWNAWRAMLLLTHCSATPHGPGWWLQLQPLHLHSRQKDGGRNKERVTDSGQLSSKETSKNQYTTPQYSELSKSLIRKGGWLLIWGFCYYGISGTASNFSHTHKPSTTVNLSLFAPKYHSLCASHFCQTIISFWNFLVSLLCLKKKKKLIHSSRLSSYFLSLVSIYYMPDAVLRTMYTLILFSRLPRKIGFSSTPLPADAMESWRGCKCRALSQSQCLAHHTSPLLFQSHPSLWSFSTGLMCL